MNNKLMIALVVFLVTTSCLLFSNVPSVKVANPKIGIELNEEGLLAKEANEVPSDVEIIYLEFFLDVPDDSEITLEYRWFLEDTLVQAGPVNHTRGYTIAILDRDPNIIQEFPEGNYRVEVWFLNTMIVNKTFEVR